MPSPVMLLVMLLQERWPHHHFDSGAWWTHWIWMIVWVVLLVLIIVLVVRALSGSNQSKRDTAREILERRYAEGEISTEEYEERKKRL